MLDSVVSGNTVRSRYPAISSRWEEMTLTSSEKVGRFSGSAFQQLAIISNLKQKRYLMSRNAK